MKRIVCTMLSAVDYSSLLRIFLSVIVLVPIVFNVQPVQGKKVALSTDRLIVGIRSSDFTTLDPSIAQPSDVYIVTGQVYETLVTYDAGSTQIVAGLAESWSASADQKDWTFTLRPGVTFQDGEVCNAAAVKSNFERWWDPANAYHADTSYPYVEYFLRYKDDPEGSLLSSIETSADQTKVIFHLSQPFSTLPDLFTHPSFAIASPKAIQAGTLSTQPVGTGAYSFVNWESAANTITLSAFADYTGDQPRISTIEFRQYASYSEQMDAILNNELHIAYGLPSLYYDEARQDIKTHVTWKLPADIGYLGMNRTRGPLANLNVRMAIAYAIDKQSLIDTHYDPIDQVADQFLPPEIWGRKADISDYAYDPAYAQTLLSQAGYPQDFPDPVITLEYRDAVRAYLRNPAAVAASVQAQLQAIGLQVEIENRSSDLVDRVSNGDADMFLLGWAVDYPHPDNFFRSNFCADFGNGFGDIDNDFCNGLQATLEKTDLAEQKADYAAANQYIHDQLPLVPLAYGRNLIVIRAEVAGLEKASIVPENFRNIFWADGPSEVMQPDHAGSLEVAGAQVPTTTLNVPAGAVEEKIVLAYSLSESEDITASPSHAAITPSTATPPAGMMLAAPQFELSVYKDKSQQAGFEFSAPIDIAIQYHQYNPSISARTLKLYYWNGSQWIDAAATCAGTFSPEYDSTKAILKSPTCLSGTYALYGKTQIYLPSVVRQAN